MPEDRDALRSEYRRLSMRAGLAADPVERQALLASVAEIRHALHGSGGFDGAIIGLLVEGDNEVEYDDGDSAPLHCTIAFLGPHAKLDGADRTAITSLVRRIAAEIDPFEATIVSPARFGETPVKIIEHEDVNLARMLVDEDPTVGPIREANDEHPGFLPHVSGLNGRDTVRFDRVAAMLGGENTIIPLGTEVPDEDDDTSQTPDTDLEPQSVGVPT
jgi:hypothetical protein